MVQMMIVLVVVVEVAVVEVRCCYHWVCGQHLIPTQ